MAKVKTNKPVDFKKLEKDWRYALPLSEFVRTGQLTKQQIDSLETPCHTVFDLKLYVQKRMGGRKIPVELAPFRNAINALQLTVARPFDTNIFDDEGNPIPAVHAALSANRDNALVKFRSLGAEDENVIITRRTPQQCKYDDLSTKFKSMATLLLAAVEEFEASSLTRHPMSLRASLQLVAKNFVGMPTAEGMPSPASVIAKTMLDSIDHTPILTTVTPSPASNLLKFFTYASNSMGNRGRLVDRAIFLTELFENRMMQEAIKNRLATHRPL